MKKFWFEIVCGLRLNPLAIVVLSILAGLPGASSSHAQCVTLINFDGTNGSGPYDSLTLGPDGNFYGTTDGGIGNFGTVFKVTINGTMTTLASFNSSDGASPEAGLTLGPDGNFYGTTYEGGSIDYGTVFQVTTNGTLTALVCFDGTNGIGPLAGLTLGPDGNFYGTTDQGGSDNAGTVFQVTASGALTTLVNFNGTNGGGPNSSLTLGSDGNFYGTTYGGGSSNRGTVFKVTTNGTLTTLVNFNSTNLAFPRTGLTLGPDGNFYGTTVGLGLTGYGTVFKVTTNGTLTTLVNFNGTNGRKPFASLTLGPDGNFYGTTGTGGSSGQGTVFKVRPHGTLTTLINFNGTNGGSPLGSLTLGPDGNFYGTTLNGGSEGYGTIFQLELPPDYITNPTDQYAAISGSAVFECQPFGTAPFAYQWLSNGVPLAGATGSSLTVANVSWQTVTNAQFQVVVTNAWGSSCSRAAIISTLFPLATAQPADQTVPIGCQAVFSPVVRGFPPLSYQWYFNNDLLAGATNAALCLSPALTNEMGNYQLVVTNGYGSVTSRLATLTVLLEPNVCAVCNSGGSNCMVYLGSYPNRTNRLWATANLALPLPQWPVIATNLTDSNGLAQFLDTNTMGINAKYYRLSSP